MKELIKVLDEVVMKQVFDKDEYIIAVSRAQGILEKLDGKKISGVANNIHLKILADLQDRRGLRQEWDMIDKDIQAEIEKEWKDIIEESLTDWLGGKE